MRAIQKIIAGFPSMPGDIVNGPPVKTIDLGGVEPRQFIGCEQGGLVFQQNTTNQRCTASTDHQRFSAKIEIIGRLSSPSAGNQGQEQRRVKNNSYRPFHRYGFSA